MITERVPGKLKNIFEAVQAYKNRYNHQITTITAYTEFSHLKMSVSTI
jgi:hypothetical protein